jgi:hypothetical protein
LLPLKVSLSNAPVALLLLACLSSFPLKNQQNVSLSQTRENLRGLKKDDLPLFTPLNGFAFGQGSGVAFAFGNSMSASADDTDGEAVAMTAAQGGGYGGGVGYVDAPDVGSAYGGGRGGGNVSSLEMNYGVNKGSYTYTLAGGQANTTFNGVSSGGGFGNGKFGGLFVLEPDTTLDEALTQAAADAAKDDKKGKGKDKDKPQVTEEATIAAPGFYASFGNTTTGGGGGGFGFTDLYAAGNAVTNNADTPEATAYGKGNSGVNASASGFGFGGGSTNLGYVNASGGGFGGGDVDGAAGGQISAGDDEVGGDTKFNATGGGSADGGASGFFSTGLLSNP